MGLELLKVGLPATRRYDTRSCCNRTGNSLLGDPTIRSSGFPLLLILALAALFAACDSSSTAPDGSSASDTGASAESSATNERPPKRTVKADARSVLLITIDTTRADRLEPYGATNVKTPEMLRLAQRGITFEKAWAVAPITLVAHTSILSGLYPFEHGVRNNGIHYVPESVTTMSEILRDQGYRTAAFISAAVLDRRYGLEQGFEVYDDDLSERTNLSPRMVADRPAGNTIDAVSKWLDGLGEDEKYFAWVHLYDPHASYSPPAPFRDEYRDRPYEGEIAYMDHEIGRLLRHPRALAAEEQGDAPIVTVIGDHGESLGEHGERTHAILAYDSTMHIPWILYVPGGPAGVRVKESVGQVDLMPTLLSLLDFGAEMENLEISGRDLKPVLEGRVSQATRPYYSETYLPFYTYGWAQLRTLRQGRWKLIDAPQPELYDLQRDPRELTDLHDLQDGVAHDLQRDLNEWLERDEVEVEADLSLDSEALAKLRSLGYLSVGSGPMNDDENIERKNPMEMIEQHVGLERARAFLADRLYDQAEQQLTAVMRRDPQNLAALIDLIRAKEGQGEIVEALRLSERALELDPNYTQTYMTMARLEAQREELETAIELSDIAIAQDPINPEIRIQKATFLNRMKRHEEAGEVLTETLAEHPEHPRANAVYAQYVEARSGDLEAAEARLKDSIARDPFISQTWLFLGQVQERRGLAQDALVSYRQGLVSRPDDPDLHGALGHLLARQGQHSEAIAQLREAIRLSPQQRTEFHVSLGSMLAEMGRLEEAEREYDKVLQMNPDHPGARNNRAIAFYRSGRMEEAKEILREVVEKFPRHADSHNNLAAIAVDQKRWEDAIRHSRRTLELSPKLVEAWNNLAIGLEETGKMGEASDAYRKALELDPEYWPAYYNLGFLLKKTGKAQEAVQSFSEVLLRVPNHAETHLELGEIYAGPLQDVNRARTHWNAFIKHAPGHPRQQEVRQKLAAL